jgi:hypothetical protein
MANAARIDGTIDGAFVFHQGYAFNKRINQLCTASDHRFTMAVPRERRGGRITELPKTSPNPSYPLGAADPRETASITMT